MAISGNSLADLVAHLKNQAEAYQPQLDLKAIPCFNYSTHSHNALEWARGRVTQHSPFPIKQLLEALPYTQLSFDDNLGEFSGYIERQSDNWKIGINAYHKEARQRFTMAHELGHLLFHKEYLNHNSEDGTYKEKEILWRSSLFNKVENEANTFASDLLMPKNLFEEQWNIYGDERLEHISAFFNVSTQAARYRAYKLGLRSDY